MKYYIIVVLFLFSSFAQAQDDWNVDPPLTKKGKPILPENGDWAIGTSAMPFLSYIGNFLGSGYNDAPYFTSTNGQYLSGKIQISEKQSYRIGLMLGVTKTSEPVGNASDPTVYDKEVTSSLSMGLYAGIEKYKKIKGRMRGYYGADVGFVKGAYAGGQYLSPNYVQGTFSYYDEVDSDNNFKEKGGSTFGLYCTGFFGIEYFIAPKISISGEFAISVLGSFAADRKYIPASGPEVLFNPGVSQFEVITDPTSTINLFFYF